VAAVAVADRAVRVVSRAQLELLLVSIRSTLLVAQAVNLLFSPRADRWEVQEARAELGRLRYELLVVAGILTELFMDQALRLMCLAAMAGAMAAA
jgi:hypothetical protein